ncbi:TlpA disulfide reductase family protein [Stenotrophomonas sp. YIM B06876]|uniref:TlpA family protein disulfide reductase n=1 Tax=Stenotrophomonas sp. YIM B06876 TaxID=3060211 RepID=UPI002738D1F0|nr:TlpA disulfide reductase family protein [Stenotrophomonas sp. YIM B06876]
MAGGRRLWTVVVLAAAAGLGAGLWLSQPPWRSSPLPAPAGMPTVHAAQPGEPMPALTLPDLDGTPLALPGRFAGRPLLINVWASWCGPCVEEMPELARFSAQQGDNGIQVVGLALDSAEAVREFLQQVPVDYPVVLETPGPADASVALGNTRGLLPYSVLVGADGRIVRQKLGAFAPGELDHWAQPAP